MELTSKLYGLPSATSMGLSCVCECTSLSIFYASFKALAQIFFCSASPMMSDTLFAVFVDK